MTSMARIFGVGVNHPVAGTQDKITPYSVLSERSPSGSSTPVDIWELKRVIAEINEAVQGAETNLSFSIDEVSGKQVVKVIDHESQEVIRQYPAEEVLHMQRYFSQVAGLLVDEEA